MTFVGDQSEAPEIWPSVVLAKTVDEAIDALRSDPELFVRGGALTRVIESDGTDPGPRRENGAPVTRRVVPQWLTERLSLYARFMKTKATGRGKAKKEVAVQMSPPPWLAVHVIARGSWDRFRGLTSVVTSPTMRRDGTVIQTAGYDDASGILYLPNAAYRPVPEQPTMGQAIAARDRLLEVIADFPVTDLGRAVWLSLLFTLCARDLVDGQVPLFAADAHSAGSGKGLFVRAPHIIAFGVDIAHMSLPPDDEEFRKQITTTLLSGDAAVLFDNVSAPIGGDSIETLITAPLWKVRLLGKNEDSGSIPVRIVVVVTGNGLHFGGDMGRRTLRALLDTPHESPEERDDYNHPERAGEDKFLAWVRAHRAALVIDALTILRAWHVNGRRGDVKPWGSFQSFSSTVASCVQWIGLPDPTLARATSEAALDPQRQALSVVYDAIRRLGHGRGVTTGDLVRTAFPSTREPNGEDDLAEAIAALTPNSRGDAATRGRLLGRKLKAGRIINGQRLVAIPAAARAVRYAIVAATEADAAAAAQ